MAKNLVEILAGARLRSKQKTKKEDVILAGASSEIKPDY